MALQVRKFAGTADLKRMKELHRKLTRIEGTRGHWVSGRVEHVYTWGGFPDPEPNVFLLENPNGELPAYAITYPPGEAFIRLVVHPKWRRDDQIAPFIRFLEEHLIRAFGVNSEDEEFQISTQVNNKDRWLTDLMQSIGYVAKGEDIWSPCYVCDLSSTKIPDPRLPENYSFRVLNDLGLVSERVKAQRAGFDGHSVMTETIWKQCRCREYYRTGIDVVVLHNEQEVVSGCLCYLDPDERVSEIEDVFTVPGHRRLGLAKTMLTHAFLRLKDRGIEKVIVRTGQLAIPAQRLYESLGMDLLSKEVFYGMSMRDLRERVSAARKR